MDHGLAISDERRRMMIDQVMIDSGSFSSDFCMVSSQQQLYIRSEDKKITGLKKVMMHQLKYFKIDFLHNYI